MDKLWDYIIETQIATEEELKLVTCINGYNEDALNSVIYARTGYRSMEQIKEIVARPKGYTGWVGLSISQRRHLVKLLTLNRAANK